MSSYLYKWIKKYSAVQIIVGIDVPKEKSTITVRQPLGVVIVKPYDVLHTAGELEKAVVF